MFEHIRAHLASDRTAAEARVAQAVARRDQVAAELAQQQAALPPLQQAVTAAEATLAARNADLAAAQAVVNQRTAVRDSALAERDDAQAAFDANGGDEPPAAENPEELRQWRQLHDLLLAALRRAQADLDAAEAQLQQAIPPRNAAAAAVQAATDSVTHARGRVTAQNATIAATRQRLTAAEEGIPVARADVDAVTAKITALDAREATLTAAPLDRPALERAADVEEADLQAGWRQRRALFERRVVFREGRAGVLAAHDSTVDELAVMRNQIPGSPAAATFPGLAAVVTGIDAVLADNAAQRSRPPLDRADDLDGLRSRLTALMFNLQDLTGAATADRDSAAQDLAQARAALITHQQEN